MYRQHRAAQGLLRASASSSRWRACWPASSAWITGLRREQSDAPRRRAVQRDRRRAAASSSTRWPTGPGTTSGTTSRTHDVPYNPLHDQFYPSIGCAPCTRAIAVGEDFRAGRWWWEDEAAKECGLHVKHERRRPCRRSEPRMNAPLNLEQLLPELDHTPPRLARGRSHLHPARSRRRLRAPGPAVLRRQGFAGAAAAGREGLQAPQATAASRAPAVPAAARRHRPQLPRSDRVPRPPRRRAGRAAGRGPPRRFDRSAARCAWRTRSNRATATRR